MFLTDWLKKKDSRRGSDGGPAAGIGRGLLPALACAFALCGCSSLNICVDESGLRGQPAYSPYADYGEEAVTAPRYASPPPPPPGDGQQAKNGAAAGASGGIDPQSRATAPASVGTSLVAAPQSDLVEVDKAPTTPLRPGTGGGGDSAVSMTQAAEAQLNAAASLPTQVAPAPAQPASPAPATGQAAATAGQPVAMTDSQVCYDSYSPADISFGTWFMSFLRKFSADDSQAEARALAEACQTNPCGEPSFAEIRKAKADAQVAAELKATGGDLMVKQDGSSSDPSQVKFVAAPGALAMRLKATADLNQIDGVPHALMLVVYHLSDRTAFDQLAATGDGVRKLLEGVPFDASVKSTRQIFVQPGLEGDLIMERAEDGRFVAMVAGFNHPDASSSVYVTSYGVSSYSVNNGMLRKSTQIYTPRPLNLEVTLGRSNMSVTGTDAIFDNVKLAAMK